ncbi:MAG: hypothetical protein WA734_15780 [Candidatus Acidiferrales bacterium]
MSTVLTETVTLNASQIENATLPISIVPAPGAHKMLQPITVTFQYQFGTTPYTLPPQETPVIGLCWGTNCEFPHADISFGGSRIGFLDQTANRLMVGGPGIFFLDAATVDDQTAFENVPLEFASTGNPTGGDGKIRVTVNYVIVHLGT